MVSRTFLKYKNGSNFFYDLLRPFPIHTVLPHIFKKNVIKLIMTFVMLSENISQEMREFKGFVYATFSTRNGFSMRFDADGGREACDEPRLDSITQPSSSLQQQGCDRSSAAYSTDLCVYVYYYIDIPHFAATSTLMPYVMYVSRKTF